MQRKQETQRPVGAALAVGARGTSLEIFLLLCYPSPIVFRGWSLRNQSTVCRAWWRAKTMSSSIFCRSLPRSARHATPRASHVARLLLAIVGDEVELSHQVRPGPVTLHARDADGYGPGSRNARISCVLGSLLPITLCSLATNAALMTRQRPVCCAQPSEKGTLKATSLLFPETPLALHLLGADN